MKRKFFAMLTTIALFGGMFSGLSASASSGQQILKYTFDSETKKILTFDNATYPTLEYSCFDGYDFPFLYNNAGVWGSGWYTYTNDAFNGTPSATEMYIQDGKLMLSLNAGDYFRIRIPVNPNATEDRAYNVNFTMKRTSSSGQYLRIAIDESPARNESNDVTFGRKGGEIANFGTGDRTYNKTVSLSAGIDHELYIVSVDGPVSFSIDEFTITEVGTPEVVNDFPVNGAQNVSVYTNPVVTFDNALDETAVSNIKLMNGDTQITTSNSLDSTGKKVTLVTSEQLPANKEIKIVVPDTVLGVGGISVIPFESAFTTGDENVLLDYDFEKETVSGNLGMMYGYAGWGSTKELAPNAPIDGSQALKVGCTQEWNDIVMYVIDDTHIDNMKIEGNNIARAYTVEYDLYIEGAGKVGKRYEPTWGVYKGVNTYDALNQVIHVKDTVELTTAWNPCIRIYSADNETKTIYVDNVKITEILPEEGAPRIISATPANGAENVRGTSNIEILFNQEIPESSFDDVGLYMLPEDENEDPVAVEIKKTVSQDFVGRTILTVEPEGLLDTSSMYGLDMVSVKNSDGTYLEEDEQTLVFMTSDVALDKAFATIKCDGTDITGTKLTSDIAGKTVEVTFDGFGLVESESYTGYLAVYVNGVLDDVDLTTVTVTDGEAAEHKAYVTLPESFENINCSIAAFLWNDMTPVMNSEWINE